MAKILGSRNQKINIVEILKIHGEKQQETTHLEDPGVEGTEEQEHSYPELLLQNIAR